MAKRRTFSDRFKAKIALEALRANKTVHEIAARHQVHPNHVITWKRQTAEALAGVFNCGCRCDGPTGVEVEELLAGRDRR
ncbi:MAG: transposase [Verrucomicrobiota bacterium]